MKSIFIGLGLGLAFSLPVHAIQVSTELKYLVARNSTYSLKEEFGTTVNISKNSNKLAKTTKDKIKIDLNKCIFCGKCQRECPTGAITVKTIKKHGKNSWEIDNSKCITCKACIKVCPKKCLTIGVNKN